MASSPLPAQSRSGRYMDVRGPGYWACFRAEWGRPRPSLCHLLLFPVTQVLTSPHAACVPSVLPHPRPLRMASHPRLLSARQQALPLDDSPHPHPHSARPPSEPSSVWGSFRRRGRGQGLIPLFCAASPSHFRSPGCSRWPFTPSLDVPQRQLLWLITSAGSPTQSRARKPLSRGQWPSRPIMRRPQCCLMPYVALAKGEGRWGAPCPHLLELNYSFAHMAVPLPQEAPGTCTLPSATCPCACKLGRCLQWHSNIHHRSSGLFFCSRVLSWSTIQFNNQLVLANRQGWGDLSLCLMGSMPCRLGSRLPSSFPSCVTLGKLLNLSVVGVQSLSWDWLFATPWTEHQAPLFYTVSQSLLKLMSIESVMLSHLPSLSPFAFNLSQHQDLFQWVGSWHQMAEDLELQFQHQFFQ